MNLQWIPYAIPLIITGISAISVAILLWGEKSEQSFRVMAVLMAAISLWTITYALELSVINLNTKLFWYRLQFIGMAIVPISYFIICMLYSGDKVRVNARIYLLLAAIPLATVVLVFTNKWHGLMWQDATLYTSRTYILMALSYNIGSYIFLAIVGALFFASALVLVKVVNGSSILYKSQTKLLLTGSVLPIIILFLDYFSSVSFKGFHSSSIAISLTMLIIIASIKPTSEEEYLLGARGAMLENIDNAIIFLDNKRRIIDLNTAAQNFLNISTTIANGKKLEEVEPDLYKKILSLFEQFYETIVIDFQRGGRTKTYSVSIAPLGDGQGWNSGHIIVLRDNELHNNADLELQNSMAEIRNLNAITEALLGKEDFSSVAKIITDGLVKNFGFSTASICRYDTEKNALTDFYLTTAFNKKDLASALAMLGISKNDQALRNFVLPYKYGMNPVIDRIINGEMVVGNSIKMFFSPWVAEATSNKIMELTQTRQCINLPMIVNEKTVGMILATTQKKEIYSCQLQTIKRLASQGALSIEKARLIQKNQERKKVLEYSNNLIEALGRFMQKVDSTLTPRDIIHMMGDVFDRWHINCLVALHDPEDGSLRTEYLTPIENKKDPGKCSQPQKYLCLRLLKNKWKDLPFLSEDQPRYISDSRCLAEFLMQYAPTAVKSKGIRHIGLEDSCSLIHIPLRVRDRKLGELLLWGKSVKEANLPAFNTFATQVSTSIDNYYLNQQALEQKARREEIQKALQESEEKYRSVVESACEAILTTNQQGNIITWNKGAEKMFGYTSDEIFGAPLARIMPEQSHADKKQAHLSFIENDEKGELSFKRDINGLRRDGSQFPVEVSFSKWTKNGYIFFTGILRDITERKHSQNELIKSEEKYRQLVENAGEGIMMVDEYGVILEANRRVEEILGIDKSDMIGKNILESLTQLKFDTDRAYKAIREYAVKGFDKVTEWEVTKKDGNKILVQVRYSIAQSGVNKDRYIILYEDITERRKAEQQLRHDALHDALTGLPNRLLFLDRLERAMQRRERDKKHMFAVMFLDVDRFKMINDSLGHSFGDRVLVEVSKRLLGCIRSADTLARMGGDEFAILLMDTADTYAVANVANRIQEELSVSLEINDHLVNTGISIGVVMESTEYKDPEEYLRDADIAMYQAKSMGRARYEVFDPEMRREVMAHMSMEHDLRQALKKNEFVLHYQPIVDLADGNIKGFEALIRWQHPKNGIMHPEVFIKVAEESSMIRDIGNWVLLEACRQVQSWRCERPEYKHLYVSVNLSGKQLTDPKLVKRVVHALKETGLPPECLILEVTENAIVEEMGMVSRLLEELKRLGVSLYLDDFGTGYSSLNYLRQFPMDVIKIDRSFVNKMSEQNNSSGLIKTIILMGQELGMQVVAEGIETGSQMAKITSMGCQFGQGYYISKPLKKDQVRDYLKKKNYAQQFEMSDLDR